MGDNIGAVVLAAGLSRRMGLAKLALPWGSTTVIGAVVEALKRGGASPVVVVTGGHQDKVQEALRGSGAVLAHNPRYSDSEMLASLQYGLNDPTVALCQAVLVALGDQPQILPEVVGQVMQAYLAGQGSLIAPSYQMRRGHPWLIHRSLWPEILAMDSRQESLRDFLKRHADHIHYVLVDTPSIFKDLDTPEDYQAERPPHGS